MMDCNARGIDEIIQKAMQEGAFDNLSGKGKPLNLDENPYLDREWQLAYHLLKENGFAPAFIEQRQSIELELAAARETLARAWAWRQQALAEGKEADLIEREWNRAKGDFEDNVMRINKQIGEYNLIVKNDLLQKAIVKLETELQKLG
jgi:DnaJ family protein C protein 28